MLALMVGANVISLIVALDHFHRIAAFRAEIRCGDIPAYKVALGIIGASVEGLARLGHSLAHVAAALGALAHDFHYLLDVFALGIVWACKEGTVFEIGRASCRERVLRLV